MATFSGTVQKCKSCDKVVHFIEMISADGVPYHKTCFRCSQCNGLLAMGRYHLIEEKLYCKAHFEQYLKENGSVPKKPSSAGKPDLTRTPSKLSSFFSGTQEKCRVCSKTVYPLEKVTVEGEFYHKLCFKCAHGGCKLTASNYAALDGYLYCKPHFSQLFKEKGSYNHLTKTASDKKTQEGENENGESKPEDDAAPDAAAVEEEAAKAEEVEA